MPATAPPLSPDDAGKLEGAGESDGFGGVELVAEDSKIVCTAVDDQLEGYRALLMASKFLINLMTWLTGRLTFDSTA